MTRQISSYMTADHRRCDEVFSALEKCVMEKEFDAAEATYAAFQNDFLAHFRMEEEVMFPDIEGRTGMVGGPTQVMRMEHEQMRHVIAQMGVDLQKGDYDHFLGLAETFIILVQQHNMKEEQILYNMADQILADVETSVVERMKAL